MLVRHLAKVRDPERLGYPTQKPEALLERIINASSNERDLVLDPFCGTGRTLAVAVANGRRGWGCDLVTDYALSAKKTKRTRNTVTRIPVSPNALAVRPDAASGRSTPAKG